MNAAAQTPVPRSSSDQVVGVMLLRKPKSLGRYDTWTGIVTSQRMIFAQMTEAMLKNAIQTSRDQAKAEGKGFWGQWQEQMRVSLTFSQRYLTMDPSAALAETPGNCAVYNNDIRELKVHVKDLSRGEQADRKEFEIEVNSNQGKYQFRMDERDEYVKLLKQVYGERVKMPFGYFSHTVRINF